MSWWLLREIAEKSLETTVTKHEAKVEVCPLVNFPSKRKSITVENICIFKSVWISHFIIFLIYFFYWRIIASQNFAVFCQTSTWISHKYTYIPSLLNLPPISLPSHPSRLIQSPCLSLQQPYSKFLSAIYFTYGNVNFHVTLSIHLTLSSPLPILLIQYFLISKKGIESFSKFDHGYMVSMGQNHNLNQLSVSSLKLSIPENADNMYLSSTLWWLTEVMYSLTV